MTVIGNRSTARLISHSLPVEFLKAQFWDHCSLFCMSTIFIAAQRNLNSIYLLMTQILNLKSLGKE